MRLGEMAACVSMHRFTKGRLALVLCFVSVLARIAANGSTYFVATNGSDSNDGASVATPFRTIRNAAVKMVAGDRCIVRGGVYRETLMPMASGTREAPIVFAPYKAEAVMISGADAIELGEIIRSICCGKRRLPWRAARHRHLGLSAADGAEPPSHAVAASVAPGTVQANRWPQKRAAPWARRQKRGRNPWRLRSGCAGT